ncbi:hypothetical protein OUZ56_022655 [Daphnia magna]|uniref:Uncharacterized protein n=1 Tax=Daphnia magna TaxID=35525 RepID=A0ABR0AX26_9CRUS|nr:hypothetical protein OUZ56_022655 [Daphnia magna]
MTASVPKWADMRIRTFLTHPQNSESFDNTLTGIDNNGGRAINFYSHHNQMVTESVSVADMGFGIIYYSPI